MTRSPGGDEARALSLSPDGSTVFVTGYGHRSTSGVDYATGAYDATTETELWGRRYDGPASSYDYATALGVSPDGTKVFVTGASIGSTGKRDYATAAYDAATGTMLWVRRYNGQANGADFASSLGVSPDGSTVFVTGSSDGGSTNGYDHLTAAYDASTGVTRWVRRYNEPANGDDFASGLGVSPTGPRCS